MKSVSSSLNAKIIGSMSSAKSVHNIHNPFSYRLKRKREIHFANILKSKIRIFC